MTSEALSSTDMPHLSEQGLRVLFDRETVFSAIDRVAAEITQCYQAFETVNLVPVITGGMQFAAALLTDLERRAPGKWIVVPVFAAAYIQDSVISEPAIEFPGTFDARIRAEAPVLVLDDLLDSGTTMQELMTLISKKGIGSTKLAVLLERARPRQVDLKPDFCGFELDSDAWVVGFGMDNEQRFRGLDGIYLLDST
jgi:hypoxanthine phosphoribosyltransferase